MTPAQTSKVATSYLCASLGRYSEADGVDYLGSWIADRPSFSLDVFRAVIGEWERDKEIATQTGRKWSRPSIRQITTAYDRRLSNETRQASFAAGSKVDCSHCDGRGITWIVVAGQSPADAKPVPRSRFPALEPSQYAITSVIPCICAAGSRSQLRDGWSDSALRRLVCDCGAPAHTCGRVAMSMRRELDCARGLMARTTQRNPFSGQDVTVYVGVSGPGTLPTGTPATPREARQAAAVALQPAPPRQRDPIDAVGEDDWM